MAIITTEGELRSALFSGKAIGNLDLKEMLRQPGVISHYIADANAALTGQHLYTSPSGLVTLVRDVGCVLVKGTGVGGILDAATKINVGKFSATVDDADFFLDDATIPSNQVPNVDLSINLGSSTFVWPAATIPDPTILTTRLLYPGEQITVTLAGGEAGAGTKLLVWSRLLHIDARFSEL